jgi:hypothetical protein
VHRSPSPRSPRGADGRPGQLAVAFSVDPALHSTDAYRPALARAPAGATHILAALPRARPPGLLDRAGAFLAAAVASAPPDTDLGEHEVLEADRDADVPDDDPDPCRDVRVACVEAGAHASARRRWEVVPIREKKAMTGAM